MGGLAAVTFIGLDLAVSRDSDFAVVDSAGNCSFGTVKSAQDGLEERVADIVGESFVLAIDGPQGLAGCRTQPGGRDAERILKPPVRMPHDAPSCPGIGAYSQYAYASLRLFRNLTLDARFRLLGLDGTDKSETTLLEVFPGAAWKALSNGEKLPGKRTNAGVSERYKILSASLQFPDGESLTHDQLDAALAAMLARELRRRKVELVGKEPWVDESAGFLREGYIVQPMKPDTSNAGHSPLITDEPTR